MRNILIGTILAFSMGVANGMAEDKEVTAPASEPPVACCEFHLSQEQAALIEQAILTSDLPARTATALRAELARQYQAQQPQASEPPAK